MSYPKEHLPLFKVLSDAFFHYAETFKATLFFTIIAVIIQDLYLFMGYLHCNRAVNIIIFTFSTVIALYLWCAAIVAADCCLKGESKAFAAIAYITLKKMVNVISVIGIYILLFIVSIYWMRYLDPTTMKKASAAGESMLLLMLVGVPLLLIYLSTLFVIPKILTSDKGLFQALKEGVVLVWKSQFKPSLALYFAIFILGCITWPLSNHGQWLWFYHLKLPFDIVALTLLAPVVINFMLLSLNNPLPVRQERIKTN